MKRCFGSDNYSGAHSRIIEAIANANNLHTYAYGEDEYTEHAVHTFKKYFGENVGVRFVFNGTAANVLSIRTITDSYNAIICAETAHLYFDECGAVERFTGCHFITIKTINGKISINDLNSISYKFGNQHCPQPKVISISQPTELGTLYSLEEINSIANFAHENNMLLHMDGARLSNASASMNLTLKEISFDLGVDVLSFGGTKNGMLFGDAIIFKDNSLLKNFKYLRKQGMQLASKMRFIAVQFDELFHDDLWLENARHSNKMASLLKDRLMNIPKITIKQEVETNVVFAYLPIEYVDVIKNETPFLLWNEKESLVRFMCGFDTEEKDIDDFICLLIKTLNND
ncbi:low specificity L-threonine aldolase [Marinilabiliaceae bacterium JC040]|nr:low specificity L-threonine aldolase [Marinilabiliaceae bacterium JC040]